MRIESKTRILLLHPPVVKPCEPPAGIARLAGALQHYGLPCTVVDLNLEGLLSLMNGPLLSTDRWTHRAFRNLPKNLSIIRKLETYHEADRYKRSVMDLNRVRETSSLSYDVRLGLANYQHRELSAVRSSDLIRAAETPEENPFFTYFEKRLVELLELDDSNLVGISLNYLSQALCAFAIIGIMRRKCPEINLVLGGGLVTSWMRRPGWKSPFDGLVDHLVAGPGESALLSIAGTSGSVRRHFTPNYDFVTSPCRTVVPLANHENPSPARATAHHSSFMTLDCYYLAPGFVLPYSSSSGCYWNKCAFCPERAEGNPYLPIPIDRAVNDLKGLVRRAKPILLHMLDNALSPRLLEALSNNPPGAPWYGFARITGHLADEDFCMALKRSGCTMLQLGIESGDQKVLDREQKGIELEVVSRALKSLRKAGIAAYVYLLFGTPSETLKEARSTLEFTIQHVDQISFLNLAIFNLPIYGPEAQELKTRMHYDGDLSLYTDFYHPRGWHRALVRQFLDKEFKRHPAIASIIRRDPPIFTSNHAPFLGASR